MWSKNPFAALLLIPALHLWLWVVDPAVRLRRSVALVLLPGMTVMLATAELPDGPYTVSET